MLLLIRQLSTRREYQSITAGSHFGRSDWLKEVPIEHYKPGIEL
jgi:hypothetical protein